MPSPGLVGTVVEAVTVKGKLAAVVVVVVVVVVGRDMGEDARLGLSDCWGET